MIVSEVINEKCKGEMIKTLEKSEFVPVCVNKESKLKDIQGKVFTPKMGKTVIKMFYEERLKNRLDSHMGLAFSNVSFIHSLNSVYGAPALY